MPTAKTIDGFTPRKTAPVGRAHQLAAPRRGAAMPPSRGAKSGLTPPARATVPSAARPLRPATKPAPVTSLHPHTQAMEFIMTPASNQPAEPAVHIPAPQLLPTPRPEANPDTVERIYTQDYPKRPEPQVKPERPAKPDKLPVKPKKARSTAARVFNIAQYPLLALVAIVAAASTAIGQWFVLAYVIVALVRRQDSRLTFALAIFLLIAIPVFQLLQQPGVAKNTAVYVYELLVFGTLQAMFEVFKAGRSRRRRV